MLFTLLWLLEIEDVDRFQLLSFRHHPKRSMIAYDFNFRLSDLNFAAKLLTTWKMIARTTNSRPGAVCLDTMGLHFLRLISALRRQTDLLARRAVSYHTNAGNINCTIQTKSLSSFTWTLYVPHRMKDGVWQISWFLETIWGGMWGH